MQLNLLSKATCLKISHLYGLLNVGWSFKIQVLVLWIDYIMEVAFTERLIPIQGSLYSENGIGR